MPRGIFCATEGLCVSVRMSFIYIFVLTFARESVNKVCRRCVIRCSSQFNSKYNEWIMYRKRGERKSWIGNVYYMATKILSLFLLRMSINKQKLTFLSMLYFLLFFECLTAKASGIHHYVYSAHGRNKGFFKPTFLNLNMVHSTDLHEM